MGCIQNSTVRQLKSLSDGKKLTTYLNSAQKMLLCLSAFVRVTKNNFFSQCHLLVFERQTLRKVFGPNKCKKE
jgi:hypothetical protein